MGDWHDLIKGKKVAAKLRPLFFGRFVPAH
jgi:hypothetical protein